MCQAIRDVFICHANEDKDEVVRPLVEACSEAGISCWYDEFDTKWGDSITERVNEGLRRSRFVLVVFSTAFIKKNWAQRELKAALNQEASSGKVRVLPLIVGSREEQCEILDKYPLLNDKLHISWDDGVHEIIKALMARLKPNGEGEGHGENVRSPGLRIPLPKIDKKFTQRDKDLFLRNAFAVVKGYFRTALKELYDHREEVETDFQEIHAFKFLATIYVRGEVANRCKIWLGSQLTCAAINLLLGQVITDGDNATNDSLTVGHDKESLGLEPSGMWPCSNRKALLSAEEAAEYLWTRLTESL
ncbi:MAG: TIR domain protein [Planctomycetes bacterium ADurb.Bin126]|nr:MAG: TIR domain protein [Planctomycetes bacterium ADurb.Bin126]HOD80760.1 toll/interleukin-1 receptor domain-containing protein [Phycisphaerae bacterium]HQL71754.1 toll/interleukin-1 receptor domain-containing protein [Phycisphaerae bacterium]